MLRIAHDYEVLAERAEARASGAMTLRTGKGSAGSMYRYYTCLTKARQGKIG